MTTTTIGTTGGSRLPAIPARIFVATVDPTTTAQLQEQLERFGLVVAGTADPGQLMQACRGCQPDLAVIDLSLRTGDGIRIAHIIARELDIPLIGLSATCDPEDAEAARNASAFALLKTPVAPEQLQAAVTVAWGRFVTDAEQTAEIARLKQRLEDRKTIEQAKWALVHRLGVSEPEAFRMLQRRARDSRRTLIVVARAVVDTTEVLESVRATG